MAGMAGMATTYGQGFLMLVNANKFIIIFIEA
jgi:hypothetical protein